MTLFSTREERVIENLRIINSRFPRKPKKLPVRGERPVVALGGSAPTLVIAASNSSNSSKARADYICFGVDDHLVILAALLRIGDLGGRLLFTEGDFYLGGMVELIYGPHVRFEGMGQGNTFLHMADGANSHMFHFPSPNVPAAGLGGVGAEFTSLSMDGNKADQTGAWDGVRVDTSGGGDLIFTDIEIFNFTAQGIQFSRSARNVWIDRCRVHDNGTAGISPDVEGTYRLTNNFIYTNGTYGVKADGARTVFVGNTVYDNTSDGFSAGGIFEAGQHVIVGNQFLGNGGRGIHLNSHAAVVEGNYVGGNVGTGMEIDGVGEPGLVAGNQIIGNGGHGVILGGAAGGNANGNVSFRNDGHGFLVNGPWHLKGNTADSNSRETDNTYDGIQVVADGCDIVGNTVRQGSGANQQRYGINITATADATYCVSNDARGSGNTADYINSGTNTVLTVNGPGGFGDNY